MNFFLFSTCLIKLAFSNVIHFFGNLEAMHQCGHNQIERSSMLQRDPARG